MVDNDVVVEQYGAILQTMGVTLLVAIESNLDYPGDEETSSDSEGLPARRTSTSTKQFEE